MKNRMIYEAPTAFAVGLLGEGFLCQSVTGTENIGFIPVLTDSDFE